VAFDGIYIGQLIVEFKGLQEAFNAMSQQRDYYLRLIATHSEILGSRVPSILSEPERGVIMGFIHEFELSYPHLFQGEKKIH